MAPLKAGLCSFLHWILKFALVFALDYANFFFFFNDVAWLIVLSRKFTLKIMSVSWINLRQKDPLPCFIATNPPLFISTWEVIFFLHLWIYFGFYERLLKEKENICECLAYKSPHLLSQIIQMHHFKNQTSKVKIKIFFLKDLPKLLLRSAILFHSLKSKKFKQNIFFILFYILFWGFLCIHEVSLHNISLVMSLHCLILLKLDFVHPNYAFFTAMHTFKWEVEGHIHS